MEHIPGPDLFEELSHMNNYRLPVAKTRKYAAHVVSALGYLHETCIAPSCIVHRDLKPENIVVDTRSQICKMIDFGFAKLLPTATSKTFSTIGTPEYMAPELIAGNHLAGNVSTDVAHRDGHGKAVDWWGFGILVYEMLVG